MKKVLFAFDNMNRIHMKKSSFVANDERPRSVRIYTLLLAFIAAVLRSIPLKSECNE